MTLFRFINAVFFLFAIIFNSNPALGNTYTCHDIKVKVLPDKHSISVEDTITLPEGKNDRITFLLHRGLNPSSTTPGVDIILESVSGGQVPLESFKLLLPKGLRTFSIKYSGEIHHSIEPYGREEARGFRNTPGLISSDGIYLAGSSFWYPVFDTQFLTFNLQIELPAGWDAVSQGVRTLHEKSNNRTLVKWESPEPQDEIFLVAASFTEYVQAFDKTIAMAFLRTPDKELADRYLEATVRYIKMYEKLIGPYPYKKFALVENFWETGFGMPSFTLLGSKIIRFPFILTSSYPHEILHNWWGNSVFPDFNKGNWSEGLTAYLSDHLIKEQQGAGADYRQTTLQKYTDYVVNRKDFPLTMFRSRHSSSSEAIGYGKSLMFFHMLRLELGDKAFIYGLQDFYRSNKFRTASFEDLRKSFENISNTDLSHYFNQWINKIGSPALMIKNGNVRPDKKGYLFSALLEQIQQGEPYKLKVPIAVTLDGQSKAYQTVLNMDKKQMSINMRFASRPLRVDIDPEYDIFRKLDRDEMPPAITQALGSEKMLVLLPSSASEALVNAYLDFAKALSKSGPDITEIKFDNEIKEIPSDRAVAILGSQNRFFKNALSAVSLYDVSFENNIWAIEDKKLSAENHTVVLTSWNKQNKDMAIALFSTTVPEALPGLSRKLPHYHKYSYLVFEGSEPTNVAKGRWPVRKSPMTVFIPDKKGTINFVEMGSLAPRKPLAELPSIFSSEDMMETIRFLSDSKLKGRGLGTKELDTAADFVAEKFRNAGLQPGGDAKESYFQTWEDLIEDTTVTLRNVIGFIPGKNPEIAAQSLVIGAHYDHLGLGWPDVRGGNKGKIHPGADDNASGIAVLLELARILGQTLSPERSIVFVAFTGEESGKKGSKKYVSDYKLFPAANTFAMLNLDTVGRLGKKKLYIIGANSAKDWMHIFKGAGFVTGVEIDIVSEELDSSDQKSFHDINVPAVQLFTGPHSDYHRPTDTADKIDPDGLVKVASVAKEVIAYLASRKEPLTSNQMPEFVEPAQKKERKVSLGTIPDFSYTGKGCRISGVIKGSPAETCGLQEGDVIINISSTPINSLRGFSDVLKQLSPGDKITIIFLRDGKEMKAEAIVTEK